MNLSLRAGLIFFCVLAAYSMGKMAQAVPSYWTAGLTQSNQALP